METSIVGDLINFRGLVYAPLNENGAGRIEKQPYQSKELYNKEISTQLSDRISR